MINITVLDLSKKEQFIDNNNGHTVFIMNICRKKNFKLALLSSILITVLVDTVILVMVPVDMLFITRSFPIFLQSNLD